MTLIVIWLLLGVASAVVATNKGRGGCAWFALGILLGPFGLLLALVVRDDSSGVERQAIATGQSKRCPYCAELIKKEAIKCRFCGSDLAAKPSVELSAPFKGPVDHYRTKGARPSKNEGELEHCLVPGDDWGIGGDSGYRGSDRERLDAPHLQLDTKQHDLDV